MSVPLTFSALAARLLAADPAPAPKLTGCLTEIRLDVQPSDLPLGLLRLARDTDFRLGTEAFGLGRLDYTVEALLFLSDFQPGLEAQYDERSKPWPEALLRALAADLTLTSGVAFIGSGTDTELATCRVGLIQWGGVNYWGVTARIQVTEKPVISMS